MPGAQTDAGAAALGLAFWDALGCRCWPSFTTSRRSLQAQGFTTWEEDGLESCGSASVLKVNLMTN